MLKCPLNHLADRYRPTQRQASSRGGPLARAIRDRPSVLLLDDPFSNLDATLPREEMRL